MFKKNILRKNYDFQKVINLGNQKVSKYLILYMRENQKELKVGISVSKKFANAVYRNKYKRQVRHLLDILNLYSKKMDVVLIVRRPFLKLSFTRKLDEIKKTFEGI
ncbi:ribonuclease P protein component [Candidatus Mycoplasma mahonii]|uniref:ribonuclease P protein component n=1 Tax=Candidatus Mycoplasma mahonii TaxID=3004105 RepID=UPI0026F2F52F|nr:ribonuclease P protein component [Candidatus Mycoplasma mahonii]WKX02486.1 ribonuclease P protein component [Candidatus Mycoplasma mahonii]